MLVFSILSRAAAACSRSSLSCVAPTLPRLRRPDAAFADTLADPLRLRDGHHLGAAPPYPDVHLVESRSAPHLSVRFRVCI